MLFGAEGADSSGMRVTREIPEERMRQGSSRAARGKRVPAVEINQLQQEETSSVPSLSPTVYIYFIR
jgi:hypothetical protein